MNIFLTLSPDILSNVTQHPLRVFGDDRTDGGGGGIIINSPMSLSSRRRQFPSADEKLPPAQPTATSRKLNIPDDMQRAESHCTYKHSGMYVMFLKNSFLF